MSNSVRPIFVVLCMLMSSVVYGDCNECCPSRCANDCGTFTIHGSYLYWRPCIEGISAALRESRKEANAEIYRTSNEIEIDLHTHDEEEVSDIDEDIIMLNGIASSYQTTSSDIIQSVKFPSDEWKSGFRVGIGYHPPCDGCDFQLNWVNYCPDVTKKSD